MAISMFLQLVGGGDVRMRIVKRKHGPAMQPVTDAEMKEAYAPPPQAERLIGFVNPEKENADSKANAPSTPSATPDAEPAKGESQVTAGPRGVIDVTTVPYLAEIYIDGKSLGYSPAKLTLPAGKYVMRVQKDGYQPWSKEINVLDSSEFTVYAELKKK
jgi:hypothetical protein